MATNFATESLKSVTAKATEPTSSVTTSDSAVAEVQAHQPLHQDTSNQDTQHKDTQHTAPTLSDSAVAELKAAYVAVEQAIADAKSSSTASSGTATDTKTTDTATTDSTTAETKTGSTSDTHQPPTDPLVKVLADATGETTATVQGVLQQVRAVQHQEHLTDASGHTDTTKDTGTSSETTSTGTATGDAKPGTGDAPHWHDRLIAQQDGSGTASSTDAGTGQAAADAGSAIWQHFLNHYASGDSAVTGNTNVVAAVDAFVDTVQSLHLDPGHGQMHGHGTDGTHLDTAA
ncbi:hypothetical protein J2848_003449 [Azospirillum lipoferum]|uniref:hypothetical protein n=1 Tax=Azospirillum TaxID=191 RepID=UPI001478C9CE|nr:MULTISPECIES: hypothetical protein [Azospirillum]MCP1611771.1 hypothetical protein [Azospirillum lipoferum]MDW5533471.1 hypothetical protein [Azospirillum sp. NL1]